MGGISVKLILTSQLFTIPFNLGLLYIISSGLTNVYIKNSADNLTKSFMITEMYGYLYMILHKGNKHLCPQPHLSCPQPHHHIHLTEEKQVLQCTNSKILFVKRNFYLLKN